MQNTSSDKKFLLRYFIIIALALPLLWLISANQTKPEPVYTDFADADPAWADTTLKYLSTDEKIAQLIIHKIQLNDRKSLLNFSEADNYSNASGFLIKTDSLSLYTELLNMLDTSPGIASLHILDNNDFIRMLRCEREMPNVFHVAALRNDSLRTKYTEKLFSLSKALKIHAQILPNFPLNRSDSGLQQFYIKLISTYAQAAGKNNILPILEERQFFKQDSANFNTNKKLFGLIAGFIPDKNENEFTVPNLSFERELRGKYQYGGLRINRVNADSLSDILTQFNAGTHLFINESPEKTQAAIKYLLKEGKITEAGLNEKVRTVLLAKTYAGLNKKRPVFPDSVKEILQSRETEILIRSVYKKSICLLKNRNETVPYTSVQPDKYVIINAGDNDFSEFIRYFKYYQTPTVIQINPEDSAAIKKLGRFNKGFHAMVLVDDHTETNITNAIRQELNTETISLVKFGKNEVAKNIQGFQSIIQVWDASKLDQKYAAESLWGGIKIQGQYPLSNDSFPHKSGFKTKKVRVAEALPEETGLDSERLMKIDSIANSGILLGAYPGCQVVVLKNAYEVFNKTYGFHTYAKRQRVRKNDVYDLASVTKVAATTTAFMQMYDLGKLRLNDPLGKFFKNKKIDYSNIKADTIINIDTLLFSEVEDFKKILSKQDTLHLNDSMFIAFDTILVRATAKNNIFKVPLKDMLLHKSGISPVLPILPYLMYKKLYYDSLTENSLLSKLDTLAASKADSLSLKINHKDSLKKIFNQYFSHRYIKDSAELRIAKNLYFRKNYFDTLWNNTKRLRVYSRKIEQYADINMILLQQALDSINHRDLDSYLKRNIFIRMGLKNISYKPYKYFSESRIVPTEDDKYWREQVLRGDVHDPSAAMLGGISGNAGLFSNASDLALIGQMWLNGGNYGRISYISPKTIQLFTGPQEDCSRALGFDKAGKRGIHAPEAPPETYGHTGFTGTCIWVDPVNEIVFVFLSNRVYPKQKNWRINKYRIRQNIHSAVYKALVKKREPVL
jgi:CubicO group peptidase (beta-lactamase class C family)